MRAFKHSELFSTYSIVAYEPETGRLGVAVQTHQPCVGRIVPWVEPGIGAVATQASANASFGPVGLALLREGVAPDRVIAALASSDEAAHRRQVAVVDARGRAAAHTGSGCIPEAGHRLGDGFSVQANMMLRDTVFDAMYDAFVDGSGDLAHRMLVALQAAEREDGDIRGMQSAALVVAPGPRNANEGDGEAPRGSAAGICSPRPRFWERVYDLRVDESEEPLVELERLVRIRAAGLLDDKGNALLEAGDVDEALRVFAEVRRMAPDQEEPAYWQALAILEANAIPDAADVAARILCSALGGEPVERWLDLADRLQACGMIERPHVARELRAAVERAQ